MKISKSFIPGIIAVIAAVSCTAFMLKDKKQLEPCSDDSKQWFLCTLDCNSQHFNLTAVRNPNNYKPANVDSVTWECAGSTCVCAIFACPDYPNNWTHPVINSSARIYNELYWWVQYQNPVYANIGGDIFLKDQP